MEEHGRCLWKNTPYNVLQENQTAVVARAALQGHFFLLHTEHIPAEEPVAPILPQDSRRGAEHLSARMPPGQLTPKATVRTDLAWGHSAFLRARLLPWGPGLLGAKASVLNLHHSLAGWLPQAAAGRLLSSQLFVLLKGFALTWALATLSHLRESPASCHLHPPPSFPSSTASLQLLQPPGPADFGSVAQQLGKAYNKEGEGGD